jgi:hypothetical protein
METKNSSNPTCTPTPTCPPYLTTPTCKPYWSRPQLAQTPSPTKNSSPNSSKNTNSTPYIIPTPSSISSSTPSTSAPTSEPPSTPAPQFNLPHHAYVSLSTGGVFIAFKSMVVARSLVSQAGQLVTRPVLVADGT